MCVGIYLNVRVYICIYTCLNEKEAGPGELKKDDRHVDRSCCACLVKYLRTRIREFVHSRPNVCMHRVNPVCISVNVWVCVCIYVCLNEKHINTGELKEDDGQVDRSVARVW